MTEIILFLMSGVLLGWIIRKKRKVIQAAERFLSWSIYLLLFLLGIGIGNNQEIIANIGTLGYQALGISLLSITGSLIAGVICYRLFFREK